jgi:ATP-dependent helicase/nuclease subunit A
MRLKLAVIVTYMRCVEFMNNIISDEAERLRALNPRQSFIVQAPAGSGKTELLTQRVLVLLGHVNLPEEILAITFTKKASSEMRARIINALKKAATEPEPASPHAKKTWDLARAALQRDAALEWQLLTNPNRLRIQTIDSFNASLIKHLPMLSHFGAPPEITDDSLTLYREAVQEFLSHLEENLAWSDAIATLLLHMDNDLNKVQTLLINMLAKRDQWLPYIMMDVDHATLRQQLEHHLSSVITDALLNIKKCFPLQHQEELLAVLRFAAHNLRESGSKPNILACLDLAKLPEFSIDHISLWQGISELLLTNDFSWRKRLDKNLGFPAPTSAENAGEKSLYLEMKQRAMELIVTLSEHENLRLAFVELCTAPSYQYQEIQWETLSALYQILRIVVAQLKVVFQLHGKIDYIENSQAALFALGSEDNPTDLALTLDYQIRHLLIDEFQDTSNSQYRLIEKMTTGWETDDGRTLFVVGDPMQSIYRFREAEVGLFIRARKTGIGHIRLEPLTLSVNFRSTAMIVDWVNKNFRHVLPAFDDIATGAVSYSASIANQTNTLHHSEIKLLPFINLEAHAQAEEIVRIIQMNKQNTPTETIAILVRSRTHLEYIIPALKKAQLVYRAIDIDPLTTRAVIQDLMALTRALLHPADRIAWLAILRAPWCGLSLADLLVLDDDKPHYTVWEQLQNAALRQQLSEHGQQQLARIMPILLQKIGERRRYSLRLTVESTWLLLGGPACVEQESDLEDVNAYLTLLEKLDHGGDLLNLDNLTTQVSKLYASSNKQADNTLQIMTIHNSKGLEFDTVILPHLERKSPNQDKQLLLWMERPRENESNALILAPVNATGDEPDSIYDFIKKQHAIKMDYENGRLLYVAATRAKKHLHLLFSLQTNETSNEITKPTAKSLLEKLWVTIKNESYHHTPSVTQNDETVPPRHIKRLTPNWNNPLKESDAAGSFNFHQKNPGIKLADNSYKSIGILVHQILQQISHHGISWWHQQTQADWQIYIRSHLRNLGMLPHEMNHAADSAFLAIQNTLKDKRGQWILASHTEAQAEFALTAVIENKPQQIIIDRTFVDESGVRWIIDYKTAHFMESDLTTFIENEQAKYTKQMQQYYVAIQKMDARPIRLGLYFPLIPAWSEWSHEEAKI